jgi:aminopeptidase N
MGQDTFDRFMRTYVEHYQWEIATTQGFRQAAEETCACDLSTLFEEWVYEE